MFLKVARGGSTFKPKRGASSASVSVYVTSVLLCVNFIHFRCRELLVVVLQVVAVWSLTVEIPP